MLFTSGLFATIFSLYGLGGPWLANALGGTFGGVAGYSVLYLISIFSGHPRKFQVSENVALLIFAIIVLIIVLPASQYLLEKWGHTTQSFIEQNGTVDFDAIFLHLIFTAFVSVGLYVALGVFLMTILGLIEIITDVREGHIYSIPIFLRPILLRIIGKSEQKDEEE